MTELPYQVPRRPLELLRNARSILLATHENPDPDGLGSVAGCGLALPSLGYRVARLGSEPLGPPLDLLPGIGSIPVDDGIAEYDLGILFDCRSPDRLGVDSAALSRCRNVLVIDHHPPGDDEESAGEDWIVVTAPATTLLVLSMIDALGGIESISADVATNLYAGLVVDTGGFRHPSTTASALRAGGLLVDRGADASGITELLLHRRRPEAVQLLAAVLERAHYEAGGRVVFLGVGQAVLRSCGARAAEAEGLISIASAIEGVTLSVMHLEDAPGRWRVSLRAHPPWRVDRIARANGGGGHVLAAGFRVEGELAALQAGLLESWTADGAPGVTVTTSVTAGSLPASSRITSTMGSAKV